nr:hypothetical protein [Tanacetum cinerariifolium]
SFFEFLIQEKIIRDVITVGSTMRIPLLYRGEYSQWRERFMNYLEEQTDGEAMINSIQNGDQPLPVVAPVSLAGTAHNAHPTLKDPKSWTAEEKKTRKIDRLARSLLIQGISNDIYSLIDSNETAKDLWDALERQMCGSEYAEQDRKAAILFLNKLQPEWKQYGTLMRQTKNLMDINIDALYNILKQNQGDVNDALGYKKKVVMVTSDPLALVAEKTKVSKRKEKVVVSSDSEGSGADDISELKKISALLAKAFNRRKFYSKPTNNNLRTSSTSQSANKKQEFVKSYDKKVEKKDDEKKRDMSKVKCYNCKKERNFAKDCKKAKVKDYNYYKTKMLLAKKDSDEQVLLAEDQAWMESINLDESSSSAEETIAKVAYYTSESESESEYKTLEYYDNSTNYGLFLNNGDDQEIFHDAIESASENFIEYHIDSQKDYAKSEVDHNDSEEKEHFVDKLIQKFNHKIAKCQKRIEKANQQTKGLENQNKDLQDNYDVLLNQVNTFEEQNNEFNEQIKVLNEKNADLLAQTKVLQDQLKVKHVVIDTHTECQAYMIRYSALCDNDNQHRKKIDKQEILFDKMSHQIVQICLWIIDSGCSKHMTGNRALLTKFVEKFFGTVRFGNNDFAVISGYGDVVKHVVIDTHTECQAKYAKLKEEIYEYIIRYSALCDNDKQHRKKIDEQEILFDKMSRQLVEMNNNVLRLQEKILEKETKISELEGCVLKIQVILKKQKILRPNLYDEKVIGLGYTSMFLIHSDEALEIEKFKRARENKIEFAYDYGNLNASYLSCNNSHLGETSSAYVCNDAMNVSCNSRMCDLFDENNLFIFDEESVRISPVSKMPFRKKTRDSMNIVQICLWIIDSGCSKHMTGNRALLTNFAEKFLGMVRFGNNDFAVIAGYGDVKTQVNLQLQIQRVRTDNGTEFKNKTLAKFFDDVDFLSTLPHEKKWTKDHPLHKIIGDLKSSVRTRGQLANSCLFSCLLSFIEPANVAEALRDADWIMKSPTTNVETSINDEVFHEISESFQRESSSSSLNDDVQQSPEEVILPSSNTQSIPNNMVPNGDEESTSHNVLNERLEDAYFDASTSFHNLSNVHTYYQSYPHEKK